MSVWGVKGLKTFIEEQRIKKGSVDLGEIQREGREREILE
jgi:hypothetical protein